MKLSLYRHRKRLVWVAAGLASCAIAVPSAYPIVAGPPSAHATVVGPPFADPTVALPVPDVAALTDSIPATPTRPAPRDVTGVGGGVGTLALLSHRGDATRVVTNTVHGRGAIFTRHGRPPFLITPPPLSITPVDNQAKPASSSNGSSNGTDWTAAGAGAGAGFALGLGLFGVAAMMSRKRRTFAGV